MSKKELTIEYVTKNNLTAIDCVRFFNSHWDDQECEEYLWNSTCFPFSIETMAKQLNNQFNNNQVININDIEMNNTKEIESTFEMLSEKIRKGTIVKSKETGDITALTEVPRFFKINETYYAADRLDQKIAVFKDGNLLVSFLKESTENTLTPEELKLFFTPPKNENTWQPKTSLLQEAESIINGSRAEDYGSVTENFNKIAVGWKEIFADGNFTPRKVALAMCWLKICRDVNTPKHDNILDLAGYAGCVGKMDNESNQS